MNQNLELLEYVYKVCDMGVYSSTKLLKDLEKRDNKINKLIEEKLKEYEKYLKESKKLIKKYGGSKKTDGMMTKMSADMSMKMEVMMDNSDSRIADMMIKGLSAGIIEMEKKIDRYQEYTEKNIIKLAKNVWDFQKQSIDDFKQFL